MHVFVTTVVRGAALEQGGSIIRIDWDRQVVERTVPVPCPVEREAGPRGARRGGRGICRWGDSIVVANYDTLYFYDRDLNLQRQISHRLFCGLHEVCAAAEGIWVSSTGVEGILLVDPDSGEVTRKWFAPLDPVLQAPPLSLTPRPVDESIDYRRLLFARAEAPAHTNCVWVHGEEVYATLSNCGAVVRVFPSTEIRIHDPDMKDPHNGIRLWDGRFIINDTSRQTIRIYDEGGVPLKSIDLNRFPIRIRQEGTMLGGLVRISMPGWLRGLSQIAADRVLVGISPAAVLEVDIAAGELIGQLKLSDDVNNSVHGLLALAQA